MNLIQWALEQGLPCQWQAALYNNYRRQAYYQSWQCLQKHYSLAAPPQLHIWSTTVENALIVLPLCSDIKTLLLRYC